MKLMDRLENLKKTVSKSFKRTQKIIKSKKGQKSTENFQKHKKQRNKKKKVEAKAKYDKLFGPILFGSVSFFVVLAIILAVIPC